MLCSNYLKNNIDTRRTRFLKNGTIRQNRAFSSSTGYYYLNIKICNASNA